MTELNPNHPSEAPDREPATADDPTPWVVVLVSVALGLAFFIFLALVATQAGAPGA